MNLQGNNECSADTAPTNKQCCHDQEKCVQQLETINSNNKGGINSLTKSRFEEVEIKLEKMFAGIEDEQCMKSNNTHITSKPCYQITNLPEKTFQTKAAVKSTDCIHAPKQDPFSLASGEKGVTDNETTLLKSKEVLKSHAVDSVQTSKDIEDVEWREKTFATKLFDSRKNIIGITKDGSTNVNNIGKKKTLLKKKIVNETKTKFKKKAGNLKFSRQKIRNRIGNPCSSSDNDNETDEKNQQSRDMDTKYRSPYVFIKHGGQISIVNTATADDNNDKSYKLKKVHDRKNVKGTYSSTLSNKYDADTPDSSWICVFCKRGPHRKGLGDLYGPYVVSLETDEYRCVTKLNAGFSDAEGVTTCTSHPMKSISTHGMICEGLVIQLSQGCDVLQGEPKGPIQNGLSRLFQNIEIWIHEDCAVWAPNVFLVGTKLVGLDSAISNSIQHMCIHCGKPGAIVCCLQRDCKETAHPVCAQDNRWLLNEENLWAYCGNHY
ncbi:uncharacterized protein [Musca autumnalis]|uniref:uncharacterized protein n=1 Tax=Musca autumnalis TaxID=221902 RepID=UPI003CF734AF